MVTVKSKFASRIMANMQIIGRSFLSLYLELEVIIKFNLMNDKMKHNNQPFEREFKKKTKAGVYPLSDQIV
jgi:hypothetical protein